jgi:hypothetical protein
MLHIRLVTTPGLTGRLLDRLAELPGIRNLISQGKRGAARDGPVALAAGFSSAIVLTFAFGVAVRAAGQAPDLYLNGIRRPHRGVHFRDHSRGRRHRPFRRLRQLE